MIIYKYLLKKLFPPFLFSSLTLFFIFLLQFLMRTADRMIGKGLSFWVISQLILFNLSWMLVLIIPMAVLVTILMAFGSLTQDNEFAVLKSSGVSLIRLMIPVFIISFIICYLLIIFNNKVLPDANFANKTLMWEISRVKPTLSLEPMVFSNELNNYSILARKISKENNELTEVTIYDYRNPLAINIITAKKGNLLFSRDNKKLIFILEKGELHQTVDPQNKGYRRTFFDKHTIALDASQFTFEQSGPGAPRGDRELSAQVMRIIVDSLHRYEDTLKGNLVKFIKENNRYISDTALKSAGEAKELKISDHLEKSIDDVRMARTFVANELTRISYYDVDADRYLVEIYKKYAIPFACVVFVLIGAPLGVLARKGSFGMAAGISLFFFTIYWACLIGGEKLADRQIVSPFWGMWIANIVLGILGIFLTYKMNKEMIVINLNFINKIVPKSLKQLFGRQDEEIR